MFFSNRCLPYNIELAGVRWIYESVPQSCCFVNGNCITADKIPNSAQEFIRGAILTEIRRQEGNDNGKGMIRIQRDWMKPFMVIVQLNSTFRKYNIHFK